MENKKNKKKCTLANSEQVDNPPFMSVLAMSSEWSSSSHAFPASVPVTADAWTSSDTKASAMLRLQNLATPYPPEKKMNSLRTTCLKLKLKVRKPKAILTKNTLVELQQKVDDMPLEKRDEVILQLNTLNPEALKMERERVRAEALGQKVTPDDDASRGDFELSSTFGLGSEPGSLSSSLDVGAYSNEFVFPSDLYTIPLLSEDPNATID